MISEIEHLYMDNFYTKSLLIDNKSHLPEKSGLLVMLLDDIHIEDTNKIINITDLKKVLLEVYPEKKVSIYFESAMIDFAQHTLNLLAKNHDYYLKEHYFKKQDKYVVFIKSNKDKNFKISLFEYSLSKNTITYYCVLLSLTWLLFKLCNLDSEKLLNIEQQTYNFENIFTSIDAKFEPVERNVLKLVEIIDNKLLEFIDYKFVSYV